MDGRGWGRDRILDQSTQYVPNAFSSQCHPNVKTFNQEEQGRFDMMNHVIALVQSEANVFPIRIGNNATVMDLGTGTGVWSTRLAEYVRSCLL